MSTDRFSSSSAWEYLGPDADDFLICVECQERFYEDESIDDDDLCAACREALADHEELRAYDRAS